MASQFEETYRPIGHIAFTSTSGIVTPTKHTQVGRKRVCACGIPCMEEKCGVCLAEERAGISLRVVRGGY
jgi:hypothetical protein